MSSDIIEDYLKNSGISDEKMADICLKSLKRIKLAEIILSALATTSLVYTLLGDSKAATVVAAACSTLLFCLALYTKEYNLGEIAQKHADAASKLWLIRESFLSLLTDIKSGMLTETVREKRDKLIQSLSAIHAASPRTNSKAYKEAQSALKINEELTFSDEEIDKLLPSKLRKSSS